MALNVSVERRILHLELELFSCVVEASSLTALRHVFWLACSRVTGVAMTRLICSNRVISS